MTLKLHNSIPKDPYTKQLWMMMMMIMISTSKTWRDPSVPRILRHSPCAPACMRWHIMESPIISVILIFPIMCFRYAWYLMSTWTNNFVSGWSEAKARPKILRELLCPLILFHLRFMSIVFNFQLITISFNFELIIIITNLNRSFPPVHISPRSAHPY